MPRKSKINSELVISLARIHCTMAEIAAVCKCSEDTLHRRFAGVIKLAKEEGKSSFRRSMYLTAVGRKEKKIVYLKEKIKKKHPDGTEETVERVVPTEIDIFIKPDPRAQIFLSKNLLGFHENFMGQNTTEEKRTVVHKYVVRQKTGEEIEVKPEEMPTDGYKFDQDE